MFESHSDKGLFTFYWEQSHPFHSKTKTNECEEINELIDPPVITKTKSQNKYQIAKSMPIKKESIHQFHKIKEKVQS